MTSFFFFSGLELKHNCCDRF